MRGWGHLQSKHATILWTSNALSKYSAYADYVGGDRRWTADYLVAGGGNVNREETEWRIAKNVPGISFDGMILGHCPDNNNPKRMRHVLRTLSLPLFPEWSQ